MKKSKGTERLKCQGLKNAPNVKMKTWKVIENIVIN